MNAQVLSLLHQGMKCTNIRESNDQLVGRFELLYIDFIDDSMETVTAASGPDAIDLLIFKTVKKANSM